MITKNLKGKYFVAETPNIPFDYFGKFMGTFMPCTDGLQNLEEAENYAKGFIEARKNSLENKTYAVIEVKEIFSNWDSEKERLQKLEEIDKKIEELKLQKEAILDGKIK